MIYKKNDMIIWLCESLWWDMHSNGAKLYSNYIKILCFEEWSVNELDFFAFEIDSLTPTK